MKNNEGQVMFPPPGKTPREDTAAVIKFYELKDRFPETVLKEAKEVSKLLEKPGKRLDLRKKFIFTCDPVTARDYDDALSLDRDRRGNTVLGVHIADVSHFVRPGSAIDREAARRSTSVYFADRVLPMLPDELCNGVCSLVPNEDRLAFSVFMTFDKTGKMIGRSFAKSIIKSKARFTYEQVMRIISSKGKLKDKRVSAVARRTILAVHSLAERLRANRFALGALDIEIPEAEVILDEFGEMSGIVTRPYDESHQMVEECMVAANEAVATELWTKGVKILARLHEPPDEEKLLMLRADMRSLGVKMGNISNQKV
ncbi:MAG: RNB domain-containing ribonuclease, partial [Kiritimatiellae bacterium]|nr:RNB domain-containing ribonuclease [Kiritimatiellia bacterium]